MRLCGAQLKDQQRYKRCIVFSEARETSDTVLLSALEPQNKTKAKNDATCANVLSGRRKHSSAKRGSRRDFNSPEGFNDSGLELGHSYASLSGERMEAKKVGFPDVVHHPATIDLCIVSAPDCLKTTTAIQRQILRDELVGF